MSTLTHRQKQINESIAACHKIHGQAHQVLPCQEDCEQKTKERAKQILSMHNKGMSVEQILPFLCKVSGEGIDLTDVELMRLHKTRKLIAQTIKQNK